MVLHIAPPFIQWLVMTWERRDEAGWRRPEENCVCCDDLANPLSALTGCSQDAVAGVKARGPLPHNLVSHPDWELVLQCWSEGVWVDMIVMEVESTVLYYCVSGCDFFCGSLFVCYSFYWQRCVCVFTHLNTDGDGKAVVILWQFSLKLLWCIAMATTDNSGQAGEVLSGIEERVSGDQTPSRDIRHKYCCYLQPGG